MSTNLVNTATKAHVLSVSLEDTVFLIGSGPSLKKVDMSLLKNLNTIGMNRQYISYEKWGFYPKHYFCIDGRLVDAITSRDSNYMEFSETIYPYMIENPECTTETYCFNLNCGLYHGRDYNTIKQFFKDSKCHPYQLWIQDETTLYATNKDGVAIVAKDIPLIGNCGAFASLVSFIYGYKRVVLLGIDAHYAPREQSVKEGEDLSHYDPNYFDVSKFEEQKHQGPSTETSGLLHWKQMSLVGKRVRQREPRNGWDLLFSPTQPARPSTAPDMIFGLQGWGNTPLDIVSCSPDSLINMGEEESQGCFPYIDLQEYLSLHE